MFNYEEWVKEFSPKLKNTRRWEGFKFIANRLSQLEAPKILEIGCIRVENSWEADGQSTQVWNWMMENGEGVANSFDLDEKSVSLARALSTRVNSYVGDGLLTLAQNQFSVASNLDLLFLDGMDFTGPHAYNAWMQHIGFLAAAWPRLKKGALVAVDDCVDNNEGKHVMIKDFFRRMGNAPLVESYVHIWEIK